MADDKRLACARGALEFIRDGAAIGLGGGSTIALLVGLIKDAGLRVKVATPSVKTRQLCIGQGLEVLHTSAVEELGVAFDGCDELDDSLNALKSGGGIHTKEKLIASMAREYILLGDESKRSPRLTFRHPVVLEVLEDGLAFAGKSVRELGGRPSVRSSPAKDGFTVTENGNLLLDAYFDPPEDIALLESRLMSIRGVVDTSLFVGVAVKAILAGDNGIRILERP